MNYWRVKMKNGVIVIVSDKITAKGAIMTAMKKFNGMEVVEVDLCSIVSQKNLAKIKKEIKK